MAHFMCQRDSVQGHPELIVFLGVSERVFLDEMSTGISGL